MKTTPNEENHVEQPLIAQLKLIGWQHLKGDIDVEYLTERNSFREVLLLERLKKALLKINRAADLSEVEIDRAIRELQVAEGKGLLERNELITTRLVRGVMVQPSDVRNQRQKPVKFIDFEHPEQNDFLVINQFRVNLPGGHSFVVPDVVLFVNGIPLVAVECKSPSITEPITEAIDQLLRYSNNRPWVEEPEGIEDLFIYNQLMIATDFYRAVAGTVGSFHEHYNAWKDTSPTPMSDVAKELGIEPASLKGQQILTAGMLRPAHLLDILQNFILFMTEDGRRIKLAPRYHQYRSVQNAVRRLQTGETKIQDGVQDRRGGIIWHTQGSGKSITMVHLVRKMRSTPKLRGFKVVICTDRTQLQGQLRDTAAMAGESIRPNEIDERDGGSGRDILQKVLHEDGPDLVFAMMQKYLKGSAGKSPALEFRVPVRVKEYVEAEGESEGVSGPMGEVHGRGSERDSYKVLREVLRDGSFPILNSSEKILILVDECHRTQAQLLHANMMQALPNAAKIGFTGTPILLGERKLTQDIFGDFLDRYPMKQAVEDGATVPILYEGRTAAGLVERTADLDVHFIDMFRDYTAEELAQIKARYATEGDVLEAPRLIREKARDMIRHYASTILPNSFKAQVVASSRRAAITYRDELEIARNELVQELEKVPASLLTMDVEDIKEEKDRFLFIAHGQIQKLRRLEFAAIISGNHNDPPSWRDWSDSAKQETLISRFKKPLDHKDPAKCDPLAFLVVKSMLVTGFDAPIEQVLYLDKKCIAHDLLQTIARVNRKSKGKDCGYIIDYVGVARHLEEALDGYEQEDQAPEDLTDIRDELPRLKDRHARAVEVFTSRGIKDMAEEVSNCVDILEDPSVRADFMEKLRLFLASLNIVMPRPEAMAYLRDAKILGFIAKVAANLYRDPQLILVGVGHKVKELIDKHITANGIDPKIPPLDITTAEFSERMEQLSGPRAVAREMLHAARHHISIRLNEDPVLYQTLSQKLESILQRFQDNWTEIVVALRELIDEIRNGQEAPGGLSTDQHAPFFRVLALTAGMDKSDMSDKKKIEPFVALTIELVDHISQEIQTIGFWRDPISREDLERWVYRTLRNSRLFKEESQIQLLATQIVDLAKSRHHVLSR
jgi:type I restriction enzyme R subunit